MSYLRDSCWTVDIIGEQLLQNLSLHHFLWLVACCNLLHLKRQTTMESMTYRADAKDTFPVGECLDLQRAPYWILDTSHHVTYSNKRLGTTMLTIEPPCDCPLPPFYYIPFADADITLKV